MATLTLPVAIVVALAAGCSGDHAAPVDATPRQVVTETKQVFAHEAIEAALVGGPGDRAIIRLTAPTATLDWGIHGHADGQTQNVVAETARSAVDYEFAPAQSTRWFLRLQNHGDAPLSLEVQIELFGALAWDGWQ